MEEVPKVNHGISRDSATVARPQPLVGPHPPSGMAQQGGEGPLRNQTAQVQIPAG